MTLSLCKQTTSGRGSVLPASRVTYFPQTKKFFLYKIPRVPSATLEILFWVLRPSRPGPDSYVGLGVVPFTISFHRPSGSRCCRWPSPSCLYGAFFVPRNQSVLLDKGRRPLVRMVFDLPKRCFVDLTPSVLMSSSPSSWGRSLVVLNQERG